MRFQSRLSRVTLGLIHLMQFSLAGIIVYRGLLCRSTHDRMAIVRSITYLVLRVYTSVSYVFFVTAMTGVGVYLKIYLARKCPAAKDVQETAHAATSGFGSQSHIGVVSVDVQRSA